MKKYYCVSNGYNMLVFVDDAGCAIGFDAETMEEAKNMDISGIADLETAEDIAFHCSREDDIFTFNEDEWESVEEIRFDD